MQIIRILALQMNLTFLQTFITIIETGSLVRASQKLNVTQSTITARLKTLEDELGQSLLIRKKSGVTLTPVGTKLLRYARIMTGLWRQARFEAALPAGLQSVCTFGCNPALWPGPGKTFFEGVFSGHPEMAVSVQQGRDSDLESWLASGRVDVILTYGTTTRGDQTAHALPPDTLLLYSDRPDTAIKSDPGYIFVDHGEEYRRQHGESYHDAGVARISFNDSDWALSHLLNRGGSAYLPESLAQPHVEAGRLYVLSDAPVYTRKKTLIVNDAAADNWQWFGPLVTLLSQS